MRIKVCYIVSNIDKALAFEWIVQHINKDKIELVFLLIGRKETALSKFLSSQEIVFFEFPFQGKADIVKTWFEVVRVLRMEKPNVVHTHLYYANLIGLSSAWLLRIPKRIHTRHHASIHHDYHPRAVYLDKLLNAISTDIIVMSKSLSDIVCEWEGVPKTKLHLIPHGFDLTYFEKVDEKSERALRLKYNIPDTVYPLVGVISRFTEWKGVQYIIPAFRELLIQFPNALLILANAQGDYSDQVKLKLSDLPTDRYRLIVFEDDIASLYKLFTVFVHIPTDKFSEAFGQTYVEALAANVPSVFTLSGIASDFIIDDKNAIVVDYKNHQEILNGVLRLLKDPTLRDRIVIQGQRDVQQRFSIQTMVLKLEDLYQTTS